MLCEISTLTGGSFFAIWMSLNVITFTFIMLSSGPVFYFYYWPNKVNYQKWRNKVSGFFSSYIFCSFTYDTKFGFHSQTNPTFPSVEKVRNEILQMLKGMMCATLCPAASLFLAQVTFTQQNPLKLMRKS